MLTETAIRQAKPGEKLYRLSDNSRTGLCLEVGTEGGKRWRLRYRFQGKAQMISLGTYPNVSLKEAREKAAAARKELENGVEPSGKRKMSTLALDTTGLFRTIVQEWFERFKDISTPKYSQETWARLEREVLPVLGNKKITEIDAPAILSVLRRIENRDAVATVYKVKSHISQIMQYAIACGLIFNDPSRDLTRALKPKRSTPRAAIIDPREVGRLMLAIDSYPYPVVRSAMLIAALSFVRPGELRKAEWSEFDLKLAEWRIPAEKMKMKRPHIVPLSHQALAVLEKLRCCTGDGTYLFPSARTGNRSMSDMAVNAALRSLGYSQDTMCGHGFRAMASSLLAERGWTVDAIERQLAHVEGNKIRAVYHRSEHLEERRRMMQSWGDYLDQLRRDVVSKLL
jgi:integrase